MSSKAGSSRGSGAEAVPGQVVTAVVPPDPRWPLLHRWSQISSSPPVNPFPNPPSALSIDGIEPTTVLESAVPATEPTPVVKGSVETAAPATELLVSAKPPASPVTTLLGAWKERWPSLGASNGKKTMDTVGFVPEKKAQGKVTNVVDGSQSIEDES